MASEKILKQKQELVESWSEKLKSAKSIVLVDYRGINVASDTRLRADLRKEEVEYKVVKNNILRRACEKAGLEGLTEHLNGTVAVALGSDEVAPARLINKYVKENKDFFNMKYGYIDGKYVNAAELTALASLPSRDELISQVAGTFNNIIASFARVLNEVAKQKEAA
ncbi:MAG: 50S ribosomal protein L10 [Oscillospiraceae bacterium]|nr:50S ribosomal protein L10 [Oscillospiraceae bacterium]